MAKVSFPHAAPSASTNVPSVQQKASATASRSSPAVEERQSMAAPVNCGGKVSNCFLMGNLMFLTRSFKMN